MKRKNIKKEVRILIWNKCNQRCAYCGCSLEYKDMQVDHLHPISRSHLERELDPNRIENLMPSCRSCNFYKGSQKLERWRKEMMKVQKRLTAGKSKFLVNLAVRYGIIEFKTLDVLFYFERIKKKDNIL